MNPIQIDFREALMIVLALAGAYFFLVKTLTKQFKSANDVQLDSLKLAISDIEKRGDGHISELRSSVNTLTGKVHQMQIDLPREFVRKEDYVQAIATTFAKIDAVQERQGTLLVLVTQLQAEKK